MAITAVHDWLQRKGPFARGVELLALHGKISGAQRVLFDLPESPFSRQKLEEALRAVNEANEPPIPKPKVPAEHGPGIQATDDIATRAHKRSLVAPAQEVTEHSLPKELQPLRRELNQLWRELMYSRGTMRNVPDGMELRGIAERVVELRRKIRAGWRQIEHWRATGDILKLDDEQRVLNPVDLMRRERSLTVWLSQRKNGHRKSDPEQVQAKQKELEEIRSLLKREVDAVH